MTFSAPLSIETIRSSLDTNPDAMISLVMVLTQRATRRHR